MRVFVFVFFLDGGVLFEIAGHDRAYLSTVHRDLMSQLWNRQFVENCRSLTFSISGIDLFLPLTSSHIKKSCPLFIWCHHHHHRTKRHHISDPIYIFFSTVVSHWRKTACWTRSKECRVGCHAPFESNQGGGCVYTFSHSKRVCYTHIFQKKRGWICGVCSVRIE